MNFSIGDECFLFYTENRLIKLSWLIIYHDSIVFCNEWVEINKNVYAIGSTCYYTDGDPAFSADERKSIENFFQHVKSQLPKNFTCQVIDQLMHYNKKYLIFILEHMFDDYFPTIELNEELTQFISQFKLRFRDRY